MEERVPEVRFKDFEENWIKVNIFDLVEKIIDFRGRTPKKLGMNWSPVGYLALSALNVKDGYIDYSQDIHYGSQELYDKWMKGNELHKGQVLFTTEAPMGNVAQIPDDKRYILSQRTIAFCVNERLITESFFALALRSPKVFSTLLGLSSGGTAKGVSQRSLASVELSLSKNIEEQECIGNLLNNLDTLISLTQQKLTQLKTFKKSCLEKMFPKDGETVPEVRFQGFEGPWERKTLGDLMSLGNGRDYKHLQYGSVPVYGTGGYMTSVNDSLCDKDSIGIGRKGTIDKPYILKAPFWTVDTLFYATPKEGVDLYYLFGLFQIIDWKSKDESTGVPSLSKQNINGIETYSSSNILEQRKIGIFFNKLDNDIELLHQKLDKLKFLKQACLEKMFV